MNKKYIIFYKGGAFVEDSLDDLKMFIDREKKSNKYNENEFIVADITGVDTQLIVNMCVDYGGNHRWFDTSSINTKIVMNREYSDYIINLDELEEE